MGGSRADELGRGHAAARRGATSRSWWRQAGGGIARSVARAAVKLTAHGQRAGRWRVTRRAERVSRPGTLNSRRRRTFVVTIPSPRPMRAVQRARLWAITWTASQAPLAANFPEGMWFKPTPYL